MNRAMRWIGAFGVVLACATAAMGQTTGVTVFAENFEGDLSAWQIGDANPRSTACWDSVGSGFGGISAHGGSWMGYCAGFGFAGTAASPRYQNSMNAYMRRTVDLSAYASASLTFASYVAGVENGYDYCRVWACGASKVWTKLWEQSSPDSGWTTPTNITLNSFVGTGQTSVVIQFEFDSDASVVSQGWYLDDIALTATPAPVDLLLTNLVVTFDASGSPVNLWRKNATPPQAMSVDVGLTARSGAIAGRAVTINFFLSPDAKPDSAAQLIGSATTPLLGIQPGKTVTVNLTGTELAGFANAPTFSGRGFVIASMQTQSDDTHTNNDWTSTPVLVDDYSDTFAGAASVAMDTDILGAAEDVFDVDDFRVSLTSNYVYVITLAPGTTTNALTNAVLRLYGADQATLIAASSNDVAGGLDARITYGPIASIAAGAVTNITWGAVTNYVPFTNTTYVVAGTNYVQVTNTMYVAQVTTNVAFTNITPGSAGDTGIRYIQVMESGGDTGAYVLHIRAVPLADTNATADVQAVSVSLALASGDVHGRHPTALAYMLHNNGPAPVSNGFYSVAFYLSTNGLYDTSRLIGHSELTLNLDIGQSLSLSVPASQLGWTTIPADLPVGAYVILMHVVPVPTLAVVDPNDANNWIAGAGFTIVAPVISGRIVKVGTSTGVTNVTISFSNGGGSATTDASGAYINPVPYGWVGTATPSTPAGGFFTVPVRTYGTVTTNLGSQSYTWTPPVTIAGKVTKSGVSAGVAGVTITVSNGGGTTTTDTNGNYAVAVTNGWSGTVTPSSATGGFAPTNRPYSKLKANQTAQNFIWTPPPVISGKVTKAGTTTGVAGVQLTFTGVGTTATILGGTYSMIVPYNWIGTVTPSCTFSSGTFTPTNKLYSKVIANQTQNYTWSGAVSIPLVSPMDGMTIAPMLLPHAPAGVR